MHATTPVGRCQVAKRPNYPDPIMILIHPNPRLTSFVCRAELAPLPFDQIMRKPQRSKLRSTVQASSNPLIEKPLIEKPLTAQDGCLYLNYAELVG